MNDINWEDIRLFRLVAETGSLTGASSTAKASAATIGRKIQRLEQGLGAALFEKTQTGYVLTAFGQQLFDRTHSMALTADELTNWRDAVLDLPLISISATPEFQWLFSRNIHQLWSPKDHFRLSFEDLVPAHQLEHSRSYLLITASRPIAGNVKVASLGYMTKDTYCSVQFDQAVDCNWIGRRSVNHQIISPISDSADADAWITLWASSFEGLVAMIQNNAGRGILPKFIGENDASLVVTDNAETQKPEQYFLVSHGDGAMSKEIDILKKRLKTIVKTALDYD